MLLLFDYEPLFIVAENQRTCDTLPKCVKHNTEQETAESSKKIIAPLDPLFDEDIDQHTLVLTDGVTYKVETADEFEKVERFDRRGHHLRHLRKMTWKEIRETEVSLRDKMRVQHPLSVAGTGGARRREQDLLNKKRRRIKTDLEERESEGPMFTMEQLRMEWDLLFNCYRPQIEDEFARVVLGDQDSIYFKDSQEQLQADFRKIGEDSEKKALAYVEKSKLGKGRKITDLIESSPRRKSVNSVDGSNFLNNLANARKHSM